MILIPKSRSAMAHQGSAARRVLWRRGLGIGNRSAPLRTEEGRSGGSVVKT